MDADLRNSEEYKFRFKNISTYRDAARVKGVSLEGFLVESVGLQKNLAALLIADSNPAVFQPQQKTKQKNKSHGLFLLCVLVVCRIQCCLIGVWFLGAGVYITVTRNIGPKWESIVPSGGVQAFFLGLFFIIVGIGFFRLFIKSKNSFKTVRAGGQFKV